MNTDTFDRIDNTSPEEAIVRILGTAGFALGLLLTISTLVT